MAKNGKSGLASAPTTASSVVRPAAFRKKDRTAAQRSARYRKRKASQAIEVIDTSVARAASVAPTVTESVTERRDADAKPSVTPQQWKAEYVQQLADAVTVGRVTLSVTRFARLFGLGRVTPEPSRSGVDYVTLRRDIAEWVKLHQKIERIKERRRRNEWRGPVSDQVARFVFLSVGVAFFVLLGYAAAHSGY
jgi:hypothetical protein